MKILEGVEKVPESKLVLNGDESLLGKLNVKNPCIYYGFNVPIHEDNSLDLNATIFTLFICSACSALMHATAMDFPIPCFL